MHKAIRFFFLAAQFGLLAISIPKVAIWFHAYDKEAMGPLIAGVDIRSWAGGMIIDGIVAVTTWAALHKFEATRKRTSLVPAVVVIAPCIVISMIANYEDAALTDPAQYAHISIFTIPALLLNPVAQSLLPVIVLLLIVMVPSVLAETRTKTLTELEAEAAYDIMRLNTEASVKEAKARNAAKLRGVQTAGWKDTFKAAISRTEDAPPVLPETDNLDAQVIKDGGLLWQELPPLPAVPVTTPQRRMTKKLWEALLLKERVLESGLITAAEVAEVLGVVPQHARKLIKDVPKGTVPGRTGVPYRLFIDALYARQTVDALQQAKKLESVLGLKKSRQLHAISEAGDNPTIPLEGVS